ncbi:type I restriction-modification system, S subunit [Streptococcus pneumoniae]|nr:restriction endonuclease subunit S [Streptococcus pneumoniae]VMC55280.1 type I restriction-modification system, S subunit [Streptococcus pneumoniae]
MFGENKIFESIDNLFDIIDGDRGKNYPKSDELFSEEYCLFLNTKNVTKNGFSFDTKQFITKTKDKLLRKGKLERYDIVLTTRGTVGNVAYYDELIKYKHLRINSGVFQWCGRSAVLNQHIFKVVFDKIDIDKSYFKYVVEKGLQDAVKHTHGSTMKHLTKKYFDNIIVPYTNLGEQQRIASELDLLSKLILRRQEQLEELNLLVKSRFNEMFGDVILNEKEWKVSKWNEILTIRNGKNQKQVEDADGKFPIYGSGGIMGYAKDWIVKKNSVIIGRKGNINKPILVRENFWNVDTAFGLEPVLEKINSEYLFYFCQLYNFEKLNKAVTIPSLTKSDLLNISIPLPPLALQNEFADFVVQVDKSQLAIQKSLEELETLKKSLMQEYFG